MATLCSILAWRIPCQRSLAASGPWRHRVRHDWSECMHACTRASSSTPGQICAPLSSQQHYSQKPRHGDSLNARWQMSGWWRRAHKDTQQQRRIMPFAAKWMVSDIIILSEVSQKKTTAARCHPYVDSKVRCKWTYLQNSSGLTDTEQTCGCPGEGLGRDEVQVWAWQMPTNYTQGGQTGSHDIAWGTLVSCDKP